MAKQGNEKLTIAVFSNSNSGVFRLAISKRLFVLSLTTVVLLLTAVFALGAHSFYSHLFNDQTAYLLQSESVRNASSSMADAVVRVHEFERELRLRSSALEAVLQDTKLLGPLSFHGFDEPSVGSTTPLSLGGGDGPTKFVLRSEQSKPEVALRQIRESTESTLHLSLEQQHLLLQKLDTQIDYLRFIPLGAPVEGRISSDYGTRSAPFARRRQMHWGIDIAVDRESIISATADGKVVKAEYQSGYGKTVIVDHGNGIETLYSHLSSIHVAEGDEICRGQQIGSVGSTGNSTGPHVHYETRINGRSRDPKVFLELANFLKFL